MLLVAYTCAYLSICTYVSIVYNNISLTEITYGLDKLKDRVTLYTTYSTVYLYVSPFNTITVQCSFGIFHRISGLIRSEPLIAVKFLRKGLTYIKQYHYNLFYNIIKQLWSGHQKALYLRCVITKVHTVLMINIHFYVFVYIIYYYLD